MNGQQGFVEVNGTRLYDETAGAGDAVVFLNRQTPQAHQMVVAGAGHMANMEAPNQVNAAMLEFLGKQ